MNQKLDTPEITSVPVGTDEDYYWTLERRRQLMRMPKAERQAILAKQAEEAAKYYEEDPRIKDIGGGDFIDSE